MLINNFFYLKNIIIVIYNKPVNYANCRCFNNLNINQILEL